MPQLIKMGISYHAHKFCKRCTVEKQLVWTEQKRLRCSADSTAAATESITQMKVWGSIKLWCSKAMQQKC